MRDSLPVVKETVKVELACGFCGEQATANHTCEEKQQWLNEQRQMVEASKPTGSAMSSTCEDA
jgi:hypothetical protein